jgi:type II secretory pathway predicted ATPase ExeA
MYKSFFGLDSFAFQASPDPKFLYLTPQIKEVLACLEYGIAHRKGFVVMTGEVGTGKTTLLKSVLGWFPEGKVSTAFVFNPKLDALDFLEFILTDFGIPPRERTKSGMLLQLNRWLVERYREGALCVIVIDEAQNLSTDLLEEIRLLTNLETTSEKLLQIVLSGQPELEEKLRLQSLRQLRQRIAIWCRTKPMSPDETKGYISERIRIAGGKEAVFSPQAVRLIHLHAKGIPRLVNLICEHSLISAYVEQIRPVPPRIVEEIVTDLDLRDHPFLVSTSPESCARESTNTATPLDPEDSESSHGEPQKWRKQ